MKGGFAVPDSDEIAVRIDSLTVKVDSFDLKIEGWSARCGDCVAFIGRNGSGKTTILESLLGLRKDARLNGNLLGYGMTEWQRNHSLRQRLGVLLQRASLPDGLYVRDIIALHRNLYRRSSPEILELLGLRGLRNHAYNYLSRGEQQRVDLFMSLAHEPELIVLDEPFTGLDARFARTMAALLKSGLSHSTVLMACHSELELSVANNMVWIDDGTIRETGEPHAVRKRLLGEYCLHASFHRGRFAQEFAEMLRQEFGHVSVRLDKVAGVIVAGDESTVRSAPTLVSQSRIAALRYGPTSLADLLDYCAHGDDVPDSAMSEGVKRSDLGQEAHCA